MGALTIAKLARAAGVGVETVRYYQRRGLMPLPRAAVSAYRQYDADHLNRLLFIRRAQVAGFTLEEIGELLSIDPRADRARVRELATRRIAELESKAEQIERARQALSRLLTDCRHKSKGPCPIIEAFEPEMSRQSSRP